MKTFFINITLIIILCFGIFGTIAGQDSRLSQYYSAPLTLNPAMTGMFNEDFRITAQYRSQWRSIVNPYVTNAVSFDTKFKGLYGGGIYLMNNKAGIYNNFNILNVMISGAYNFPIDSMKYHHISLGLQTGIIHKSVDWFKLLFDNQYDRNSGGSFDQTISSNEYFTNSNVTIPDINAGFMWYYSKPISILNPFFGASVFHINKPDQSFFAENIKLPRRYVTHGGLKIKINEIWQLTTMFGYLRQENYNDIAFNFITHYYLIEGNSFLLFGPTFRSTYLNTDALVLHAGIRIGKFTYRMSYDINTSVLTTHSKGRGAYEFSIQYLGILIPSFPRYACPRLQ